MYMEPTYIISEVVKSSMSARMSAPKQPKYGVGSTTANTERLKRQGTTPGDYARARQKRASKGSVICPICEDPIVDPSSQDAGHDSIFCEGGCKAWLHRGCAGLSKAAFEEVCKSQDTFLCRYCRGVSQEVEILSLKASLSSLSDELACVRSLVSSLNDIFDLLPSLTGLNQCSAPVSENTVTLPIPTLGI